MPGRLVIQSRLGRVGIAWKECGTAPLITRVILPGDEIDPGERLLSIYPGIKEGSCSAIDMVASDLKRFLEGEDVSFSLETVDLGSCTAFQRSVLIAEHGIPRGKVSTYGLIARLIGAGKGARAVGNALAANPFPLIVPCHRAIRSDGSIGGFQGGAAMKRRLLENEGVEFDRDGKVARERFHYG